MTEAQALSHIYRDYDPATRTAQWNCPAIEDQAKGREGWPCGKEYATVAISGLFMAQVADGNTLKTYVAASAVPAHPSMGYDCHACAPAIGAAVFEWEDGHWAAQSVNPIVGFYGGWGDPPTIDVVTAGPAKHGFLLSLSNEAQGYSDSSQVLLLPVGSTFSDVWDIEDEDDNFGACDPSDKENPCVRYRTSAAFHFIPDDRSSDYYDIEVISRGRDREDQAHPMVSEDRTEIYRFSGGRYRLLRHTSFAETRKAATASGARK